MDNINNQHGIAVAVNLVDNNQHEIAVSVNLVNNSQHGIAVAVNLVDNNQHEITVAVNLVDNNQHLVVKTALSLVDNMNGKTADFQITTTDPRNAITKSACNPKQRAATANAGERTTSTDTL